MYPLQEARGCTVCAQHFTQNVRAVCHVIKLTYKGKDLLRHVLRHIKCSARNNNLFLIWILQFLKLHFLLLNIFKNQIYEQANIFLIAQQQDATQNLFIPHHSSVSYKLNYDYYDFQTSYDVTNPTCTL